MASCARLQAASLMLAVLASVLAWNLAEASCSGEVGPVACTSDSFLKANIEDLPAPFKDIVLEPSHDGRFRMLQKLLPITFTHVPCMDRQTKQFSGPAECSLKVSRGRQSTDERLYFDWEGFGPESGDSGRRSRSSQSVVSSGGHSRSSSAGGVACAWRSGFYHLRDSKQAMSKLVKISVEPTCAVPASVLLQYSNQMSRALHIDSEVGEDLSEFPLCEFGSGGGGGSSGSLASMGDASGGGGGGVISSPRVRGAAASVSMTVIKYLAQGKTQFGYEDIPPSPLSNLYRYSYGGGAFEQLGQLSRLSDRPLDNKRLTAMACEVIKPLLKVLEGRKELGESVQAAVDAVSRTCASGEAFTWRHAALVLQSLLTQAALDPSLISPVQPLCPVAAQLVSFALSLAGIPSPLRMPIFICLPSLRSLEVPNDHCTARELLLQQAVPLDSVVNANRVATPLASSSSAAAIDPPSVLRRRKSARPSMAAGDEIPTKAAKRPHSMMYPSVPLLPARTPTPRSLVEAPIQPQPQPSSSGSIWSRVNPFNWWGKGTSPSESPRADRLAASVSAPNLGGFTGDRFAAASTKTPAVSRPFVVAKV